MLVNVQFQSYSELSCCAALKEGVADRHEAESVEPRVGKIVAPQRHGIIVAAQCDRSSQQGIEVLPFGVLFIPIDSARATAIHIEVDAVG